MAEIFISYASEDRNRVRPLAEALQERGFSVWWDRSLAAGHDYTAEIERELNAAKAVIVVWTQSSAASTFVRDEAGRARDEGRLVPVLLDAVQIPLGFGAFQAEDFTRWNGGANAPQMQILEEALKAKLEGRSVDGAAVARKRRRLMARVRLVSLLTVIALVVGIAAGGRYLFDPPQTEVTQADLQAELLRLLAEGRLTPEQAIQLAEILESGALGQQTASLEAPAPAAEEAPAPGAPMDGMSTRSMEASFASVSEAEFDAEARETYRNAVSDLLRHPDSGVRQAALQLSNDQTRDLAMQAMWDYAAAHPDDPARDKIYLVCGAVGEANDNALGQRALEMAANLEPQDAGVWRMLSRSYNRTNRTEAAQGAALVSEAVTAQNRGETEQAEAQLERALPSLRDAPEAAAQVATELGEIAQSRDDWGVASTRFAEAYSARERVVRQRPNAEAAEALEADAQQLVIALDRSGRSREACERLRQAQEAHDVAAPDAELLQRCQRELRAPLRPRVELAPRLQADPEIRQRIAPAPTEQRTP